MSLWWRIKAACGVWWSIVVTGEIDCVDDEAKKKAKEYAKATVEYNRDGLDEPMAQFLGKNED